MKCIILTSYSSRSLNLLMFHPYLQQYYNLSFSNIKSICGANTGKISFWEWCYRYEIRFKVFYYYHQSFSLLLLFSLLIKELDMNLMRYSSRWSKIIPMCFFYMQLSKKKIKHSSCSHRRVNLEKELWLLKAKPINILNLVW